ncbi:MAG TPA: hypothetical protein VM364_13545 [Vicinamibacterales bacterium]|nr:hypothetical protein [Vicinamibacterales bacterium]
MFDAAEGLADELGMSRSELYARAVAEYVARRRGEDVTRKLNEVYSKMEARLDPALDALQLASLAGEDS